ncbi:MAG: PQQ-binding-like beta-propeller repeat protein [Planctomycetia bacterium]
MAVLLVVVAVLDGASLPARGDDWPQWMGPGRDGVWRETGIVKAIPAAGLPVKWRVEVKGGYSGPAVAGGRVYLLDYERREGDVANSPSDRTTLAGRERVLCLDAATGRVIWSKDFQKDYAAPTPLWGLCGHPLVDGNRLFCLVGGEGSVAVAFDKDTGRELWRALSASESGYCPPSIIESAGVRQLVIWDADKLNALDPATGGLLWSQPLKPAYGMSIMAPRVAATRQGQVLFASGIGRVGALYTLAADKPVSQSQP